MLGLLAAACVPPPEFPVPPPDAGRVAEDAASADAERVDLGGSDAGFDDRGVADTGARDAWWPDASAIDAGTPDAAASDSGVWAACSVAGVPGVCVHVDDCHAPNSSTPGLCPGPAGIQCCAELTNPFMCDPADHPQPNAGMFEAVRAPGCPAGMIDVAGFCIDRYEAFLVEVQANGSTTAWSPYHHPGMRRVRAMSAAGAVPQGYIDGRSAEAACLEAGKRLCSDDEWLRACQGSGGATFPYGEVRQGGDCNDARAVHPAIELFGNDPNPFSRIQEPCINQLPDSVDPSGTNSACISEDGVFDMMGNLHEWTAASSGIFRGGYYVDTYRNGPGCLYRTTAHGRGHWDYSTGFRCCADP